MREILDTSIFFRPESIQRLKRSGRQVIVPAVAFTERARQLKKAGIPPERFLAYLAENEFEVESYGFAEAVARAVNVVDDDRWARLARDAMIAGHVRPGDRLWTTNPRDFIALGVHADQIVDLSAAS